MVAAAPAGPVAPVGPVAPAAPVAPVLPRGIVKSSTAAELVPLFVTDADEPAAPVVVEPTLTVAAAPAAPADPWGPCGPAGPWGPTPPAVQDPAPRQKHTTPVDPPPTEQSEAFAPSVTPTILTEPGAQVPRKATVRTGGTRMSWPSAAPDPRRSARMAARTSMPVPFRVISTPREAEALSRAAHLRLGPPVGELRSWARRWWRLRSSPGRGTTAPVPRGAPGDPRRR